MLCPSRYTPIALIAFTRRIDRLDQADVPKLLRSSANSNISIRRRARRKMRSSSAVKVSPRSRLRSTLKSCGHENVSVIPVPLSGIRTTPYSPVLPLSGTHIESHCLNAMFTRPHASDFLLDGRQIRSRALCAAQLAKGWSAQLRRAHLLGCEQRPVLEPWRRRKAKHTQGQLCKTRER